MADFDRQKRRAKETPIEAVLLRRGIRLGDVIDLVKLLDGCEFSTAVETLAGETVASKRRKPKGDGAAADAAAPPIPDFKHPEAVFDYRDADGNILYQNVRFPLITADGSPVISSKGKPDKTFRLRRPNGEGGLGDIAQIPYRLLDLTTARIQAEVVYIPEGEAKADRLREWGFLATNIAKGTQDFARLLRDADVVLMPDNDDAGWKHIDAIGAALHPVARRIRVLMLPGLLVGEDILDWVAAGGTPEKLRELAEQAPEWVPIAADEKLDPAKKAAADASEQKLIDELARLSALESMTNGASKWPMIWGYVNHPSIRRSKAAAPISPPRLSQRRWIHGGWSSRGRKPSRRAYPGDHAPREAACGDNPLILLWPRDHWCYNVVPRFGWILLEYFGRIATPCAHQHVEAPCIFVARPRPGVPICRSWRAAARATKSASR
jgi:hypothetical protein